MRVLIVSSALMALAASAFATEAASAPEAAAPASAAEHTAAAPAQRRIICRRETPIGSTIPQKVCHQEEDAAQTAQAQHDMAIEAQRNRMITVHSGN